LLGSTWVFGDQRTGLKEEALSAATEAMSRLVESKAIHAPKALS
jgi:hypothetical protein